MNYSINDVQTVWLPFNTNFQVFTKVYAAWNEQVNIVDPDGLTNISWIGTGLAPNQTLIGNFTTPASYGQLQAYPVNVIITNDGGTNKQTWEPSYVRLSDLAGIVYSYDQLDNSGNTNLIVIFQQW